MKAFFPVCALLVVSLCGCHAGAPSPSVEQRSQSLVEIHYSPAEDLERIDLKLIQSATQTLDMPMYAFTDRYLAEAVLDRARHGVRVRIYRDKGQYTEEEQRAGKYQNDSTMNLFAGNPNVQVRVKGKQTLQHLKSFCVDGRMVRDGSANWSPTGEKRQDNSLVLISDPQAIRRFQQNFEQLWNRADNQVIQ